MCIRDRAIGRFLLKSISSHKVLSLLLATKRPILEKDELHDFANDFVKSSCPCDLLPEMCIRDRYERMSAYNKRIFLVFKALIGLSLIHI